MTASDTNGTKSKTASEADDVKEPDLPEGESTMEEILDRIRAIAYAGMTPEEIAEHEAKARAMTIEEILANIREIIDESEATGDDEEYEDEFEDEFDALDKDKDKDKNNNKVRGAGR